MATVARSDAPWVARRGATCYNLLATDWPDQP